MKRLDQLAVNCRTMSYARTTEACSVAWVEDFLRFHRGRAGQWIHPHDLLPLMSVLADPPKHEKEVEEPGLMVSRSEVMK